MGEKNGSPTRNVIQADEIVEALTQEDGDTVYVLRDAQISGKLDLKHRVVHAAVDIQRCTFLDPVDLRYCEFKQAVDLSGCTFHRRFNGGFRTIYKKDLTCHGITFKAGMMLIASQVEGSTFFDGAKFLSKEKGSSFLWTSFGPYFDCSGAIFKGPASFNSISCEGAGFFKKTQFENETQQVDFGTATFGGDLDCSNATFKGPANFNNIRCEGTGFFKNTQFENETQQVDFTLASFGANLDCSDATFRGPAYFNSIRCERNGLFWNTRFENETYTVFFTQASFGSNLDCSNTTFQGPANFELLACGGDGLFNNAQFEIKKNADGSDMVDYGDVLFNLSSFASTLDFSSTTFDRAVSLEQVNVQKALRLTGTHFEKNASLYNATIGRLIFEGGSPSFAEGAHLDLRECTFQRFQGDKDQAKEHARDLVNAQDPSLFSRDPYQQLERYYSSIGDEAEAKDIYLEGRHALRENAYQQNASTMWTPRQKINDEILRVLTGYGVKIGRLFVIALIFLVLGTLMFYLPDNALQAASGSTEAPPWQEGPLYRAAYSVDLFLPVVNLHIDENWEPNGPWLQAYAIGHATVGWLIVPLLLAALAGIIRR